MLTKPQLVQKMRDDLGLTRKDAQTYVDFVLGAIEDACVNEGGFISSGSFKLDTKVSKGGTKTVPGKKGEAKKTVQTADKVRLHIQTGKNLSDRLNAK